MLHRRHWLRLRFVAPRRDFPRVRVARVRPAAFERANVRIRGNARIKGKVAGRINRRAVNTLIDVRQALRHAS